MPQWVRWGWAVGQAQVAGRRWGPLEWARQEFINIGDAVHINAQSEYGEWKEGLAILEKLG